MDAELGDLQVLVLDCQAGGATPAYGDLLELGWEVCGRDGIVGSVREHWIIPRTVRPIGGPVRELTGWSEACLAAALPEHEAWARLAGDVDGLAGQDALAP